MKTPHLIVVIASTDVRGKGTTDDVCREVQQHHTLDGKLLMERDEWLEGQYARFVLEHEARGLDAETFRKQRDLLREALEQRDKRVSHLEQCITNYKATVKELQAKRQRRAGQ